MIKVDSVIPLPIRIGVTLAEDNSLATDKWFFHPRRLGGDSDDIVLGQANLHCAILLVRWGDAVGHELTILRCLRLFMAA